MQAFITQKDVKKYLIHPVKTGFSREVIKERLSKQPV